LQAFDNIKNLNVFPRGGSILERSSNRVGRMLRKIEVRGYVKDMDNLIDGMNKAIDTSCPVGSKNK
jgi:hypothetical protein